MRWTAIEALDAKRFSEASDVWAYGILLVEIFTDGQVPYHGWTNAFVMERVKEGYRIPCPPMMPPSIYDKVVAPCWREAPDQRPTFSELEAFFRRVFDADPASQAAILRDLQLPPEILDTNFSVGGEPTVDIATSSKASAAGGKSKGRDHSNGTAKTVGASATGPLYMNQAAANGPAGNAYISSIDRDELAQVPGSAGGTYMNVDYASRPAANLGDGEYINAELETRQPGDPSLVLHGHDYLVPGTEMQEMYDAVESGMEPSIMLSNTHNNDESKV